MERPRNVEFGLAPLGLGGGGFFATEKVPATREVAMDFVRNAL